MSWNKTEVVWGTSRWQFTGVPFLSTEGSAWAHRLKIVIDKDKIGEDLTDFPLFVTITNSCGIDNYDAAHFFATVSNSSKIAFTSDDGVTQLYAEKDYTSIGGNKVSYHVKIPSISSETDTVIYAYYDDAKSDNNTYIAVIGDGANVWDADYVAVWHNYYYTPLSDSTVNNINLTPSGIGATDDDYDMRNVKSIESDSGADHYYSGSVESLRIVGDVTLEVMLQRKKADSVNSYLMECGAVGESLTTNVLYNLLFNGTTQKINTFWEINAAGDWGGIQSNLVLPDTSGVHYVAMARDVSEKTVNFHLDENSETRVYLNGPAMAGSGNVQKLYLHNNHQFDKCNVGKIGEIRISEIVRSASWLDATNFTLDDNTNTFSYEAS